MIYRKPDQAPRVSVHTTDGDLLLTRVAFSNLNKTKELMLVEAANMGYPNAVVSVDSDFNRFSANAVDISWYMDRHGKGLAQDLCSGIKRGEG